MNMADLLGLLIALVLVGAGLAGLALLCTLIFTGFVARTRRIAERMPLRSFAVGLVNFIFFGLLSVAFLSGDEGGRLLGLLLATALFSYVAIGLSAVAALVGDRLPLDGAHPLRRVVAGMLLLEVAALTPLVGWVGVPLLAGLTGYGATIIALVQRPRQADPQAEQ